MEGLHGAFSLIIYLCLQCAAILSVFLIVSAWLYFNKQNSFCIATQAVRVLFPDNLIDLQVYQSNNLRLGASEGFRIQVDKYTVIGVEGLYRSISLFI